MITIDYQKRKNTKLFETLESSNTLFLSKTQNYIPIYTRFFNLNHTNYNNVNLNNKWYLSSVYKKFDDSTNNFICKIKNINNVNTKEDKVFFKIIPLLDPCKYMIGKYDINDPHLFDLPNLTYPSTANNNNNKMIDVNNAAYVDSFFLFLTNQLKYMYNFVHGIDYYGSYLAIQNNFKINIFDDIDYLKGSEFFHKNKNILFKIEDNNNLLEEENKQYLKPITIGNNISLTSVTSFKNDIFENIFEDDDVPNSVTTIDLEDLKDLSLQLTDTNMINSRGNRVTLRSNSSCSSRSSYTNDDELGECKNCSNDEDENENENENDNTQNNDYIHNLQDDDTLNTEEDDDVWTDTEERIDAIIPKFPVQIIPMESCDETFDELILSNELTDDEWLSALMQIIMILITYQKAFHFTHNDLHSNNVMYSNTDKKFVYYQYKRKIYKVPTYGRLFKIIDFGRSIYKFDGKLFCSDSFKMGGDAATQYNTEPYLNEKKPRLDPNFSFDLCRLACSIFDYVIDDFEETNNFSKITNPVKRIIYEWCLDDKGLNMLYKSNGIERYPDFKLYKMISRCVHNHTPQAQLERPEFAKYEVHNMVDKKSNVYIIDIDSINSHI